MLVAGCWSLVCLETSILASRHQHRLRLVVYIFTMRAITIRFIFTAFAATPSDALFFFNCDNDWAHARRSMIAVAKGLFLGFTAGTPGILAGFHIENKWCVLCVGKFFWHNFELIDASRWMLV